MEGGTKRHRKRRLITFLAAAILLAALAAVTFALSPWFFHLVVLPDFEEGFQVDVERSHYSQGWFGTLLAHDVTIRPRSENQHALTAPLVHLEYNPFVLIFQRTRFRQINFTKPDIQIWIYPDGSSSLAETLDAATKDTDENSSFKLDHIGLTNARIRVHSQLSAPAITSTWTNTQVLFTNIAPNAVADLSWDAPGRITTSNTPPALLAAGHSSGRIQFDYQNSALTNLTASIQAEYNLPDHPYTYRADLDLDADPENIDKGALEIRAGEAPAARLSLTGPYSWNSQDGSLTLQIPLANLDRPLLSLLPGLHPDKSWGTLASTNQIRIRQDQPFSIQGSARLNGLQLAVNQQTDIRQLRAGYQFEWARNSRQINLRELTATLRGENGRIARLQLQCPPAGGFISAHQAEMNGRFRLELTQPNLWLNTYDSPFSLNAEWTNSTVTLNKLQLEAPAADATNRFQAAGKLDYQDPTALRGSLHLEAGQVNLSNYLDWPDQEPAPSPDDGFWAELPGQLPVDEFELTWDVGQVQFRDVTASTVAGGLTLHSNRVHLTGFSAQLQEQPLDAKGTLYLGEHEPKVDLVAIASKLPYSLLAAAGFPHQEGLEASSLSVELQLAANGLSPSSFAGSLTGYADLRLSQAELRFGEATTGLLATVADWMEAPGITNTTLHWLALSAVAEEGTLHLPQAAFFGDTFAGFLQGRVELQPDIGETKIPSVPVELYASISVARELSLLGQEPPPGATHVRMPDFLTFKGTFANPKPEVGTLDLIGAMLEQFGQAVLGTEEAHYIFGTKSLKERLDLNFRRSHTR